MRYRSKYGIRILRRKELQQYLQDRLEAMPVISPFQLELYFGEGFNWWWYDEDELHPNDSDFPEVDILPEDEYDDIPF